MDLDEFLELTSDVPQEEEPPKESKNHRGCLIALIVVLVMLSQLKSVKPKRGAAEYTKADGMRMTRSSDLFLYRTVSRIRRETDSSGSHGGGGYRGGSSGGGRRVGGGKF